MTMKGIDLSQSCVGVKMADVKKTGYTFAIPRAGYTGWGTGTQKVKDYGFEGFYADAKKAGLPVGAYWYSCADTHAKGVAEAQWMYENCLKGKQFEMPIYIDVEEPRWQIHKANGVTQAVIGFCETLEALGYFVGVYSMWSWFVDPQQFNINQLTPYTKWVAYTASSKKPSVSFNAFDIWQYSAGGYVDGINVDLNEAYRDFPAIIKAGGFNGFPKPTAGTGTNAKDVTETMKHIVGKGNKGVDANKDGKINAKDVTKMMKDQVAKK